MGGRNLYVPEELQTEILANLPAKSLMRFKSVAKSWKNLFGSPSFVSKQFSASSAKRKSNPLLMVYEEESPGFDLLKLISQDGSSPDLDKPFADEDLQFISPYGPCNGIFCLDCYLKGGRNLLILWNPATREVKVVPPPLIPPSHKHSRPLYAFGVDPNTNAYKIVKLLLFSSLDKIFKKPAIAEVYNLATDSWRIIHNIVPACYLIPQSWKINSYVNGVHCWVTWDYDTSLLCFDMRSETFERIKLPPTIDVSSLGDERLCNYGVSITNGRICYFCLYDMNNGFRIEVNVMSDYDGVERIWTKSSYILYTMPEILGFWKDSEMILAIDPSDSEQLLTYEFDNSKMWRVGKIQVNGEKCHWLREYVESIVPLNV